MARYRKGNFRHSLAKRHPEPQLWVVGSPAALTAASRKASLYFPISWSNPCGLGHLLEPQRGSKAAANSRYAHQMLSHCLLRVPSSLWYGHIFP